MFSQRAQNFPALCLSSFRAFCRLSAPLENKSWRSFHLQRRQALEAAKCCAWCRFSRGAFMFQWWPSATSRKCKVPGVTPATTYLCAATCRASFATTSPLRLGSRSLPSTSTLPLKVVSNTLPPRAPMTLSHSKTLATRRELISGLFSLCCERMEGWDFLCHFFGGRCFSSSSSKRCVKCLFYPRLEHVLCVSSLLLFNCQRWYILNISYFYNIICHLLYVLDLLYVIKRSV